VVKTTLVSILYRSEHFTTFLYQTSLANFGKSEVVLAAKRREVVVDVSLRLATTLFGLLGVAVGVKIDAVSKSNARLP
jgi:hypothetical protein